MAARRNDSEVQLASKALTRPMELRSAGPAATSMEFVLTSTTPGASGLVSSAKEISRIALEFATKVEEHKILWNVLQKSPEELLRAEPPAEFFKAVEAMKQMVQESLAASQVPKQSARLSSPACADSKKAVEFSTGKPVDVKSEPGTGEPSLEFTSIFVGSIPRDWTDEYLQVYLGGKARVIKRPRESQSGARGS